MGNSKQPFMAESDYMAEHDYYWFVDSLFVNKRDGVDGFLFAAVGLTGESGEILDNVKKVWANGHPMDAAMAAKLCEEAGDVLWYLQALCIKLGISMAHLRALNAKKLRSRYPGGYSNAASKARADCK